MQRSWVPRTVRVAAGYEIQRTAEIIEAVCVYDQIPRELVEEVAGVFEDGESYALTPTGKQEEVEPSGDGFRFRLSEINWDPRDSELIDSLH